MPAKYAFFAVVLALIGCSTLPKDFKAAPSYAVPHDTSTALGRAFPARKDNKSGFLVLNTGRQAFLARVALADSAEKSIDAQYFIWAGDTVGIILIERLLEAADRGVRVRLLLDDLTSHGADIGLSALDHHPNIEIRLYNPLGRRYYSRIFRTMATAFHAGRMTHRMHNKVYVIDNQVAIVGGRNIADEYFGVDEDSNFRDMDLLAVGTVVPEISETFDNYWNSPWSVPLEVFKIRTPSEKKLRKEMQKIEREFGQKVKNFPYPLDFDKEKVLPTLQELRAHLIWAPAEIVSDPPDKAWAKAGRASDQSVVVSRLRQVAEETKKEMLIVSPYLILSKEEIEGLGKVVEKDISVKILTNSMMSTDALPVVAVYRETRKDFLKHGVRLYETRPDADVRKVHISSDKKRARLSLHGKVTVFDRRDVFVGTFNIDPRSQYLNTEVGLLVRSAELGEQVATDLEEDLKPTNSWALSLSEKNKVVWTGQRDGKELHLTSEPDASVFKRFAAWFLSLLPIKKQL